MMQKRQLRYRLQEVAQEVEMGELPFLTPMQQAAGVQREAFDYDPEMAHEAFCAGGQLEEHNSLLDLGSAIDVSVSIPCRQS